jgi:hypothetical protein
MTGPAPLAPEIKELLIMCEMTALAIASEITRAIGSFMNSGTITGGLTVVIDVPSPLSEVLTVALGDSPMGTEINNEWMDSESNDGSRGMIYFM